jgi:chromosome segregation ATPase
LRKRPIAAQMHVRTGLDGWAEASASLEAFLMIEPAMYLGLGFLVASLLALITIPLVHARAVRLTVRRLDAATPLSMAEIQADKDQLRAEFAMSTRRLEMSVEQLKNKASSQLAELGKKGDAINRLKLELGDKTATIFALEAREKTLRDQLHTTEDELASKTNALRDMERVLADKEAELARLAGESEQRGALADGQRLELATLRTQVDTLKAQREDLQRDLKDTLGRLERERRDAEAATNELAAERGEVARLGARVALLEQQLTAQTAEAEILARRLADLEHQLAEQAKLLADREQQRDRLRAELDAARKIEHELREELGISDRRYSMASEELKAEKLALEAQLDRAREDRAKLQREVSAMKREAEATWAAERVENALLRERINDVAAEIARMTSVLDGPNSPIQAILDGDAAREHANGGARPAQGTFGENESRGTLADRIRALQTRASRLSSA